MNVYARISLDAQNSKEKVTIYDGGKQFNLVKERLHHVGVFDAIQLFEMPTAAFGYPRNAARCRHVQIKRRQKQRLLLCWD